MENASKALLMAGSVLIAIMIISALVIMYNKLNATQEQEEANSRAEKILEFNLSYESFNRKDVYGGQLLSLINKMEDNNTKYTQLDEKEYIMDISVTFTMEDKYFQKKEYNLEEMTQLLANATTEQLTDIRRKLFKCGDASGKKQIDYSRSTGRVKKMYFIEINPQDYQVNKQ